MRKLTRVIVAIIVIVLVVAGILFLIGHFRRVGAGISIDTNPVSTVLINGEQVGRTPYTSVREPGEIVVKLLPDSFEKPLAPFEAKVTLSSDVQTKIIRTFGETEDLSSGVILSYEKVGGGESSISVISTPDAAQVTLDGQVRGFTPYKTANSSEGEHQLVVSAKGFSEMSQSVKVAEGYKLTSIFKLAPSSGVENEPQDEEKVEEESKIQMVEILNTGTGFLRVRSEPSVLGAEVGRVEPGKRYLFIEKDEKSGWLKIEYEKGKEGWVTNQYAKIVEGSPQPSPSITPDAASPKASPTPSASP